MADTMDRQIAEDLRQQIEPGAHAPGDGRPTGSRLASSKPVAATGPASRSRTRLRPFSSLMPATRRFRGTGRRDHGHDPGVAPAQEQLAHQHTGAKGARWTN